MLKAFTIVVVIFLLLLTTNIDRNLERRGQTTTKTK